MSTGIRIDEIRNERVRELAKTIDDSGVSKTDGFIDETEISAFAEKVQDSTQKDWTELMGLFKTGEVKETKRAELSWGEIGNIAWNSTKNFVKGLFCDEDGFSAKRTATTVGTVAGLALAAPAAATLGASTGIVSAIALGTKLLGTGLAGYMLYDGGKKAVKGTTDYYNADTHEKAHKAMTEAMDGGVEAAMALPAAIGITKGANKGIRTSYAKQAQKAAKKKAQELKNKPVEEKPIETKPQELKAPEPKVEYHANYTETTEFYPNGTVKKVTQKSRVTGGETITEFDINGNRTRSVMPTGRNGGVSETKYTTDGNGRTRETYNKYTVIKDDGSINLTETFYGEISKRPELIVEKLIDRNGKEVQSASKEFIYSDDGKIVKSVERPAEGIVREIETYYKNDQATTRIEKYGRYSEVGEKDVIEFYNDGSVISAIRYDHNGKGHGINYYQKAKKFRYPL